MAISTLLILAVRRTHIIHEPPNLVYGPFAMHESFAAQWLEHPTGVRKVIVSIPFGDSDFFHFPVLVTCWPPLPFDASYVGYYNIVLWKSPTTKRQGEMTEIPGVCQNPLGFSSFQFPNKGTWKSPYKKETTTTKIKTNKNQPPVVWYKCTFTTGNCINRKLSASKQV